jgi:predicted nuclease of predicted toxin-antitoxin system
MIIIDENVDQLIVDQILTDKYEIFSIRELRPGISDREIIDLAKSKKGIILTEDKDFGELVFSYNLKESSVIFLRYDKPDYEQIADNIIKILDNYYSNPEHYFITITIKKIRIRKI